MVCPKCCLKHILYEVLAYYILCLSYLKAMMDAYLIFCLIDSFQT